MRTHTHSNPGKVTSSFHKHHIYCVSRQMQDVTCIKFCHPFIFIPNCCVLCNFSRQSLILGFKNRDGRIMQRGRSVAFKYFKVPTYTQPPSPPYLTSSNTQTEAGNVWGWSRGFFWSCWLILVWSGDQTFALHGFSFSTHLLPLTPAAISTAITSTVIRFLLITLGIWTI